MNNISFRDSKDKNFPVAAESKRKLTKLLRELKELALSFYNAAIHDEKTGLYNHRFFETVLEMEIEKSKRGQSELCLVMVDVDDFKKVNEQYGHFKADELLERLAKVMSKAIRKSDILSRFGGEEFLILLPHTALNKAKFFVSRLKSTIHQDKILSSHNIRISGGFAQYEKSESAKSFRERTNQALREAKRTGKDRFVSAR